MEHKKHRVASNSAQLKVLSFLKNLSTPLLRTQSSSRFQSGPEKIRKTRSQSDFQTLETRKDDDGETTAISEKAFVSSPFSDSGYSSSISVSPYSSNSLPVTPNQHSSAGGLYIPPSPDMCSSGPNSGAISPETLCSVASSSSVVSPLFSSPSSYCSAVKEGEESLSTSRSRMPASLGVTLESSLPSGRSYSLGETLHPASFLSNSLSVSPESMRGSSCSQSSEGSSGGNLQKNSRGKYAFVAPSFSKSKYLDVPISKNMPSKSGGLRRLKSNIKESGLYSIVEQRQPQLVESRGNVVGKKLEGENDADRDTKFVESALANLHVGTKVRPESPLRRLGKTLSKQFMRTQSSSSDHPYDSNVKQRVHQGTSNSLSQDEQEFLKRMSSMSSQASSDIQGCSELAGGVFQERIVKADSSGQLVREGLGTQGMKTFPLDSNPDELQETGKFRREQAATSNTYLSSGITEDSAAASSFAPVLPPDLWQFIFSFLPRQQILGTIRVVCRAWQAVVDNPFFLPHLKQYHILFCLTHESSLLSEPGMRVEKWLKESELTSVHGLIKYLQQDLFSTAPKRLPTVLRLHYESVLDCETRALFDLQNCLRTMSILSKEFNSNTWCLALVLMLFVFEGYNLQQLLSFLLSRKSGASRLEVVEFLHLVLTALRASCWEDNQRFLSHKLETAFQCAELAEVKTGSFHFTAEQSDVIGTSLLPDKIMVVKAFSGAGKTSTLVEYSRRRPELSFAYVVFNQSIAAEEQGNFPANIRTVNLHKLAYGKVGWLYRHKLHPGTLSPSLISQAMGFSSHVDVYYTLMTLEEFLQSSDLSITEKHVPRNAFISGSSVGTESSAYNYVNLAQNLWGLMKAKKSRDVPMTPGGYLKLYQLSNPRLDFKYDCLMLDDAQDASPVIADIVLQQTDCSKIFVGDPHQQTFEIGGSDNAMQRANEYFEVIRRRLTGSFRFGQEITSVCNALLLLKGEESTIVGLSNKPNKYPYPQALGTVRTNLTGSGQERTGLAGSVTVIARSNARVFEAASQCTRRRLGFVGGRKSYRFDLIRDSWHLLQGNRASIVDPHIKSFSNFTQMVEVAQQTADVELLTIIHAVFENQVDVLKKIRAIEAMDVGENLSLANVIFSTAEKAKGLEFDTVALTNDFVEVSNVTRIGERFFSGSHTRDEIDVQELNLLYVAASRARKRLLLNEDLNHFLLSHARGLSGSRVLLKYIQKATSQKCCVCHQFCDGQVALVSGLVGYIKEESIFQTELGASVAQELVGSGEQEQWLSCLCIHCAKQQQDLPRDLIASSKMIAGIFS